MFICKAHLNPFSSSFKYADHVERFMDIAKAIAKCCVGVFATLALLITQVAIITSIPIALAGTFTLGMSPIGAGLLLAVVSGCACFIFLQTKVYPPLVVWTGCKIIDTHYLIWHN